MSQFDVLLLTVCIAGVFFCAYKFVRELQVWLREHKELREYERTKGGK